VDVYYFVGKGGGMVEFHSVGDRAAALYATRFVEGGGHIGEGGVAQILVDEGDADRGVAQEGFELDGAVEGFAFFLPLPGRVADGGDGAVDVAAPVADRRSQVKEVAGFAASSDGVNGLQGLVAFHEGFGEGTSGRPGRFGGQLPRQAVGKHGAAVFVDDQDGYRQGVEDGCQPGVFRQVFHGYTPKNVRIVIYL
jgi:hypothetical protein